MTEHLVLQRFRYDEITWLPKRKKEYFFDNRHQLGDNIDHLSIMFSSFFFNNKRNKKKKKKENTFDFDIFLYSENTNRKYRHIEGFFLPKAFTAYIHIYIHPIFPSHHHHHRLSFFFHATSPSLSRSRLFI